MSRNYCNRRENKNYFEFKQLEKKKHLKRLKNHILRI